MADQIEEIKQKSDIVSTLGERIELKKAGRNFKALCPFHPEKTPSFIVSPELQIYKCFGCGKSGDVFSFLQEYEGMEFYEALKYLADKAGVKLEQLSPQHRGEKERLYELTRLTSKFYQFILLRHPLGKDALNYLTKERNLKLQTILFFKLGYSPSSFLPINKFIIEKKGFKKADLEKIGILFRSKSFEADRFRERVIFPLFDHRDNVVGFAGRILPKDKKKEVAKYINSPETILYHKSNTLYGLNFTKKEIKKKGVAVVVEGELDLISSWQAGVSNIVAIKGSALTNEQSKLLSRFAKQVVLALDSDLAGDAAAWRGIEVAEREGLEVKVARLGNFKDPDELATKNPNLLKEKIEKAVSAWDFIVESIFSKHDSETGAGKQNISREIVPILSSIQDNIVQSHYVSLVAKKLGVPYDAVLKQLEKYKVDKKVPEVEPAILPTSKKDRRQILEERFLSIAFRSNPHEIIDEEVRDFIKTSLPGRLVEEYISFSKKNAKFILSEFVNSLPKELIDGFSNLILSEFDGISPDKEIGDIKKELKALNIKDQLRKLELRMRSLEESDPQGELKGAEEKFAKLTRELTKFEAEGRGSIIP